MEWEPDAAVGDWLRSRLEQPAHWTIHHFVPRGFAAYARVLHPALVRTLPDGPMPPVEVWRELPDADRAALDDRIVETPARWADAAQAFGVELHATTSWSAIVGDAESSHARAADGREFVAPQEGQLDPATVSALARVLGAHTTTPTAGIVGVWEGWGGLLGHLGTSPSRSFVQLTAPAAPEDATGRRHTAMLGASIKDRLNDVFRRRTWQDGILSREISEAPRLDLPDRGHVLFRAGVTELAAADWVLDAPWRDTAAEGYGGGPDAMSPSLVWPDDRAWVWATEVDLDSTLIAGSVELIDALCAADDLEAHMLPEGSTLLPNLQHA